MRIHVVYEDFWMALEMLCACAASLQKQKAIHTPQEVQTLSYFRGTANSRGPFPVSISEIIFPWPNGSSLDKHPPLINWVAVKDLNSNYHTMDT